MPDIDAPTVLNFLGYIEGQRRNLVQSRNVRLAAIRDPVSVGITTRVLSIPVFSCRAAGFERGHEDGEGGCLRRGGREGCDGHGDFRLTDVAGRLVKDLLA